MPLSCVKLRLGRKVLGSQEKLILQAQHEEEWRTEVETGCDVNARALQTPARLL